MLDVVLCILTVLAVVGGVTIMILLRGNSDDEEPGMLDKRGSLTARGRTVLTYGLLAAVAALSVVILVIAVFFY